MVTRGAGSITSGLFVAAVLTLLFVKWLLALPHYVVLTLLYVAYAFLLITDRYPPFRLE